MAKSALIRKLDNALARHLSDYQSGLLPGAGHNRVTGYIVSTDFQGKDHATRQRRLNALLDRLVTCGDLSAVERGRIGPIATMTPAEARISDSAA